MHTDQKQFQKSYTMSQPIYFQRKTNIEIQTAVILWAFQQFRAKAMRPEGSS